MIDDANLPSRLVRTDQLIVQHCRWARVERLLRAVFWLLKLGHG